MSKVYFFSTCIGSMAYSNTCINAIKLLQKVGAEVVFKKDQTCCGQPSFNSGYYEETKKIATFNMRLFDKPYPIIVPSGSCTGMLREDYKELFKGSFLEEQANSFSSRVYELSEYLQKKGIQLEDKGDKTRITWHSNCHALRVAKCIDSAKYLIGLLKNVELIPLDKEEECCGFGGTFSIKEPEVSLAMVKEKIKDIQEKDIQYLISADAGCLMNISGAMEKMGVNIKTMHLYDFISSRVL